MSALPVSTDITAGTATEAQAKAWLTAVRDYLNGLFGSAGTQAQALSTLGVPLNSVVAKTAAYTVIATDRGAVIDCTTGTFTLTLTAAATLGDGFEFAVRNSGAGVITIDPSGSEQIDGVTTITLIAGQTCFCVCNGAAWKTVGRGGVNSVNGLTGDVTVAAGVTSVNGQTGAVVTTNAYSIGCTVSGRPGDTGSYSPGATIAGSSLYVTPSNTGFDGTNWSFPPNSYSSAVVIGNGYIALANVGSWRCLSHATLGAAGLWVRYA